MHAPGHLREAFVEWVDGGCSQEPIGSDIFDGGQPREVGWLLGQLWNCSDIMPRYLCSELDMPDGSTYAQAAQLAWR